MKKLLYTSILLILMAMSACSKVDIDEGGSKDSGVMDDSLFVRLTLALKNNPVTRASLNPNGGEEGDGWEYGLDYENEINDFSLFVFNGYDINGSSDAPVFTKRYFSPADVETATVIDPETVHEKDVYSLDFKIPVYTGQFAYNYVNNELLLRQLHFMVAANVGDITGDISTLGQYRNYIPTVSFTSGSTLGEYSKFVMSNERDAFYKSGVGTKADPVRMHVTIERLVSRIDFERDNYSRVSADGKSLVYELKNSEDDVLSELYLDELQIVNGSIQPSYLIKRVAEDINGTTNLTYLGDETPTPSGVATNYVIDPYSTQKTNANRDNTTLLTTLFGSTPTPRFALDPTKDNQILGYVNENTFDRSCTFAEFTTGVQLKCRFVPKHDIIIDYHAETDELLRGEMLNDYTVGMTFYMVEPNIPEIDESQRLYFLNEDDAIAYATNTVREHFCKVVKYEGGVCYYYVYMRHSNNVEVVHNTMEFGIVRNNIYRFSINAATGPGTPTPDPRHPEELKARIYVKKWVSVEHPIIYV